MKPLTQRERKLVAAGIAIALVAGAWTFAFGPLVNGFVDRAFERAQLRDEIARNQRIIASLPVSRAALAQQAATAGQFVIVAPTRTAAVTQLQSRVRDIVLEYGGTVKSFQPGDATGDEKISVRADAEITMDQLYHILKQLEIGEPYVIVENLSVVADRAFQTGHLDTMEVRFEVSARCRAAAAAAQ